MRNTIKKLKIFVLCILCLIGTTGCRGVISKDSDKITVVCTVFSAYDWAREIVGDSEHVEVRLLVDSGVDLHSYQPSTADVLTISTCDLFIYVGGESDAWVEDVLAQAENEDMIVINLLETLGDAASEEELVEGMQGEDEGDHGYEDSTEENADKEYDEHVWLSLRNAEFFCDNIEEALETLDKDNRQTYQQNVIAYKEQLKDLDQEYQTTLASSTYNTILFGDRFPFRYLVDDYGISYYAAFVGCSAETEASFETIAFLSGKLDELNLPVVFVVENSDTALAETIVENTKDKTQKILEINSLQSVTRKQIEEGATYLGLMRNNLYVLAEAMGCMQ